VAVMVCGHHGLWPSLSNPNKPPMAMNVVLVLVLVVGVPAVIRFSIP